jgi:hypothetical protein
MRADSVVQDLWQAALFFWRRKCKVITGGRCGQALDYVAHLPWGLLKVESARMLAGTAAEHTQAANTGCICEAACLKTGLLGHWLSRMQACYA